MAEKATTEMERIYTIPLRKVKASPRNHMADRSVKAVKTYLMKHMKSNDIWIDASVNEELWKHGMYTSPSRIRVRARKFDDGVVEVSLPDIEAAESIRAQIKARQEKAEVEDKKKTETKDEKKEEGEVAPEEKTSATKDLPTQPKAAKDVPTEAKPAKVRRPGENVPIIDVEGIGPKFAKQLTDAGIPDTKKLLAANVDQLAEKTGISKNLLATWHGMADLDRLESVSNQYAELLARSGITSVDQLAKAKPADVVAKVDAYLKTVERPPTREPFDLARAETWVADAKASVAKSTAKPAAKKE